MSNTETVNEMDESLRLTVYVRKGASQSETLAPIFAAIAAMQYAPDAWCIVEAGEVGAYRLESWSNDRGDQQCNQRFLSARLRRDTAPGDKAEALKSWCHGVADQMAARASHESLAADLADLQAAAHREAADKAKVAEASARKAAGSV